MTVPKCSSIARGSPSLVRPWRRDSIHFQSRSRHNTTCRRQLYAAEGAEQVATATSDRFHLAGKRSTKSANKESLGSPWGYVTSITETIATVSLGGSVNGLRVNRTKVQAKNCASARCAKPLRVPPYCLKNSHLPRNPGVGGSLSSPPVYRRRLIARGEPDERRTTDDGRA